MKGELILRFGPIKLLTWKALWRLGYMNGMKAYLINRECIDWGSGEMPRADHHVVLPNLSEPFTNTEDFHVDLFTILQGRNR